ncbi:MAG: heavy-metal-associated domain-containing protein [Armatimonadota bacterium]
MAEVALHVPEMHCKACERSIRAALEPAPGVGEVQVDLSSRRVSVQFDGAATDVSAIKRRIEDTGFDVA